MFLTSSVVCCALVAVLLMQMMGVAHSAPFAAAEDSAMTSSKLTVHFNSLAGEDDASYNTRQRRHSPTLDNFSSHHITSRANEDVVAFAEQEANDLMSLEPLGDNARVSRQRRSAAFFLSAAIKICDQHPLFCSSVTVEDEGVKLMVKISDE